MEERRCNPLPILQKKTKKNKSTTAGEKDVTYEKADILLRPQTLMELFGRLVKQTTQL